MVFVILISIVFIAELIIAFTMVSNLVKLDKRINEAANFLEEAAPKIQDLLNITQKITEQVLELIPVWIENLKQQRDKIILNQTRSLISTILFWSINIKVINRLRKTKLAKVAWKGLTLLQNVI